jgi:5S rRNA maturation endonuclease (ribonuclease M5)
MNNQIKKEAEEELRKLFENIKNKIIIVEGKRDKQILYSLGFTNVHTICCGLYELSEKFNKDDIVILTDYDKEGKELSKKLSLFLQEKNKVDRNMRRKIGLIFNRLKIRTIEEIKSRIIIERIL